MRQDEGEGRRRARCRARGPAAPRRRRRCGARTPPTRPRPGSAGRSVSRAIAALCRWCRPKLRRIAVRCAAPAPAPSSAARPASAPDATASKIPSPVSGLIVAAASPASRTRPSGWNRGPVERGRWCPRTVDGTGSCPGSRVRRASRYACRLPLPRRSKTPYPTLARPSASGNDHAYAGYGPGANSIVIRSGSGLAGAYPRSASAMGRRRQRRCAEQAPNRGVGPVGADHGARGELPVDLDAVGPDPQRPHPVPAQLRAPVERGVDQCRVEHDPRDHPVRPGAGALDRAPARASAAAAAGRAGPAPPGRARRARRAGRTPRRRSRRRTPCPGGTSPGRAAAPGSPAGPAAPAARPRCRPGRPR